MICQLATRSPSGLGARGIGHVCRPLAGSGTIQRRASRLDPARRRSLLEARHSETLLVLLSPFSPHLCAELWSRLELEIPLSQAEWPNDDPELLAATSKPIMVKVDARAVARVEIPAQASRAEALAIAYRDDAVRSCIGGANVSREVYVPGQVINFVTVSDSGVREER